MTGLHDERATIEPRRSKRSRPEAKAAEPPARRARRAEGHAPPPKRRAARAARPSSPPHGHRDSEDVTAAPPPARRVEAPAPPPKPELSVPPNWHRTAYRLRNRVVRDTSNRKPAPSRYDNGIEIKHDPTWQTPTCARVALEHYNNMNQVIPKTLVVVACAMRISCILLGVDTTVPKLDLFDMLLVAYRFHSSSECWKW
ncbi:hypothetical protein ACQJBY_056367 [Aegilops geniculata]